MFEIENAILHILDANSGVKVIADLELDIQEEAVKKYLTKHLKKADNEYNLKIGHFVDGSKFNAEFDKFLYEKTSFVDFSKYIAETLYECISKSEKMHSCDIIVCKYIIDETPKLAILKCNSKVGYTHQVYNQNTGIRNGIINHYAILPNTVQKLDEYVVINLLSYEMLFADKVYKINGEDVNMMSDILLQCTCSIAPSETVKLITNIVEKVAQQHGENVPLALSKAKSKINEKLMVSENIQPLKLGEDIFEDSIELQDSYREYAKIEELPTELKVSKSAVERTSKTHKIKTDKGIELIVPVDYYQNKDYIEFINNEDGTLSIQINNIGEILNK